MYISYRPIFRPLHFSFNPIKHTYYKPLTEKVNHQASKLISSVYKPYRVLTHQTIKKSCFVTHVFLFSMHPFILNVRGMSQCRSIWSEQDHVDKIYHLQMLKLAAAAVGLRYLQLDFEKQLLWHYKQVKQTEQVNAKLNYLETLVKRPFESLSLDEKQLVLKIFIVALQEAQKSNEINAAASYYRDKINAYQKNINQSHPTQKQNPQSSAPKQSSADKIRKSTEWPSKHQNSENQNDDACGEFIIFFCAWHANSIYNSIYKEENDHTENTNHSSDSVTLENDVSKSRTSRWGVPSSFSSSSFSSGSNYLSGSSSGINSSSSNPFSSPSSGNTSFISSVSETSTRSFLSSTPSDDDDEDDNIS